MTETSPLAATSTPPFGVEEGSDDELDWRARTGRILCGVDLRITDPDGTELPWDGKSIGEIEVRGPWITAGYAGSEESDDKFRDGWLRTGDMATVEPNGFCQIVDRTKDAIRRRGENISSIEVENEINAHPAVVESAVVPVASEDTEQEVMAIVALKPGESLDPEALIEFLKPRMATFMVPRYLDFMAELPKTPTGKIQKYPLRERGLTPTTWDREGRKR